MSMGHVLNHSESILNVPFNQTSKLSSLIYRVNLVLFFFFFFGVLFFRWGGGKDGPQSLVYTRQVLYY
jgi:hypothetical protein